MSLQEQVDEAARQLAVDARSMLGLPQGGNRCQGGAWIKRLAAPPSALQFARLVMHHVPVLIEGCIQDRPCWQRWCSTDYIALTMGERLVQVHLTPNGHADDLGEHDGKTVFTAPLPAMMTMADFFKALRASDPNGTPPCVAYLQSQDSNLTAAHDNGTGDLSPLLRDVLPEGQDGSSGSCGSYAWADEALGAKPSACNLWIGNAHSRTSMHRDHYENVFTVIRGTKTFTLYPPCEAHFLCEDEPYEVLQWQQDETKKWSLGPTELRPTPWIPIDPTQPASSPRNARHPLFAQALPPLVVTVKRGETLYLPAGWYHHVAQQDDPGGLCMCINWWYDAESSFGDRWALETFVSEIGKRSREKQAHV